jgi:hypothetical protein
LADLAYAVKSYLITGVNLKSVGNTTIITAQSGKTFIPHYVIVRKTARTGSGGPAAVSIGNGTDNAFSGRNPSKAQGEVDHWIPDSAEDAAGLEVSINSAALRLSVGEASTYTTDTADFEVVGVVR